MSTPAYITYPISVDPDDILAAAVSFLQARFPNWKPADGNLDYAILQTISTEAAQLRELASSVPDAIFRIFGAGLIALPPLNATPATVATTWTMVDSAGYTIPAGTLVGIAPPSGNQLVAFQVANSVIVLPGTNVTGIGAVQLIALIDGAAGSGIGTAGGTVQLIDALAFVASITQVAPTAGGIDAEDDPTYFIRLKSQLAMMSPRLIVPNDFAIAAKSQGAFRALAIDGYNPVDSSSGNAKMIAIAGLDLTGAPISAALKTTIAAYVNTLREVNFIVNMIDATINSIDVTYTAVALPGYDHTLLLNSINSALKSLLSSATWATDPSIRDSSASTTWINKTVLRFQDVSAVIRGVQGVDHWSALTTNITGSGAGSVDINLVGVAPVTIAGILTGTIV
jgi:hypothetical protein